MILAYLTKAHLLGCVFFVFIDNEVGVLISCISLIPKPEKSNLNPLLLAQYVYTDRVVFFITKSREKMQVEKYAYRFKNSNALFIGLFNGNRPPIVSFIAVVKNYWRDV